MAQPGMRDIPKLSFQLACWGFGLIAFLQLLCAGVALAVRVENAREVRIEEHVVTRVVTVGGRQKAEPDSESAPPVVALPPPLPPTAEPQLPPARPLDAPPIADPVVERLVHEAREARVAEDMASAILKLEEARESAPDDPNVLYELGMVHETMAAHDASLADKAAHYYQQVFELGTSGAGALYPLAARKLRDGIARPADMRGKLALGRVRIFRDDEFGPGQRAVITVPVNAAPGNEPGASDFEVHVHFFDKTPNGDPQPASRESRLETEWVSGPIDWLGGEELLRVTYQLATQDSRQSHLFPRRQYYGQVVELYYRNELIDSQAWPRHLASKLRGAPEGAPSMDPLFLPEDYFPEEFDPNLPLLPPLEDELPVIPDR